jgi:AbrB family looped-hinge helix DNA binding protein
MPTVTLKGQVTLPKRIRDALNIGPGSLVEFVMNNDGQIVLRKAGSEGPAFPQFDRLVGSLGPGMTIDEIMALLRAKNECAPPAGHARHI